MKDINGNEIGYGIAGTITPPTSGSVCGINVIDPNNPMDEFNKVVVAPVSGSVGGISCQQIPDENIYRPGRAIAPSNESIEDSIEFSKLMLKGAIKHDGDKPRWDLLPYDALKQIVEVLTIGASKYTPRNWESGLSYSRCFAALQRHLTAWFQEREDLDPETKKHHLSHAACELLFLLSYELRGMNNFLVSPDKTDVLDNRPLATLNSKEYGKPNG